jgi:hypothetical protein
MTSIKNDFNSCYDTYDFSQFDDEQVNHEYGPNVLHETAEDMLQAILIQYGIEIFRPLFGSFPDTRKPLTTCGNKTRKTFQVLPKSII